MQAKAASRSFAGWFLSLEFGVRQPADCNDPTMKDDLDRQGWACPRYYESHGRVSVTDRPRASQITCLPNQLADVPCGEECQFLT